MRTPDASPFLFSEAGRSHDEVLQELSALCAGDHAYLDGTVFNSICSEPLPIASEVFSKYLATNLGDNRIFPGLKQVEARVTAQLGELLGHPSACGMLVSGGTEANLLALVAALRGFQTWRPGVARPQVLVPQSVHFSFEKLAAILDIELVRARLDSRYRVDVADLRDKVGDRTALIVATAGTSECGAVDDVAAIADIASREGIHLHVDAATGGFLIPFARELGHALPAFDFSVPGVCSITVDPHKYGGVPPPAGYLLFRDPEALARLDFASHYQGTFNHASLLGTRPGASVLAVYAALRHLGREGYRRLAAELFEKRDYLVELLAREGYALEYPPELTIVGVRVDSPGAVLARLEGQGLIASVSKRHQFLRLVVQRHLQRRDLERFVQSLKGFARKEAVS